MVMWNISSLGLVLQIFVHLLNLHILNYNILHFYKPTDPMGWIQSTASKQSGSSTFPFSSSNPLRLLHWRGGGRRTPKNTVGRAKQNSTVAERHWLKLLFPPSPMEVPFHWLHRHYTNATALWDPTDYVHLSHKQC